MDFAEAVVFNIFGRMFILTVELVYFWARIEPVCCLSFPICP
jgi:hypothetical protein